MKHIVIPSIDPRERTTRDLIIYALLKDFPLNVKEIHRKVNQYAEKEISYRAIYGVVNRLFKEGMLKREGIEYKYIYSLNIHLIQELHSLLARAELTYMSNPRHTLYELHKVRDYDTEIYYKKFSSLRDMETFIMQFEKEERSSVYSSSKHFWWHILYPHEVKETIEKILKNPKEEIVGVSSSNTPIERLCVSWSKKIGQKTTINPKGLSTPHIFVIGDYVVYAHYPPKLLSMMSKKFSNIKKIEDIPPLTDLYDILEEKEIIPVIFIKDIDLAKLLKSEVKKKYSESR